MINREPSVIIASVVLEVLMRQTNKLFDTALATTMNAELRRTALFVASLRHDLLVKVLAAMMWDLDDDILAMTNGDYIDDLNDDQLARLDEIEQGAAS